MFEDNLNQKNRQKMGKRQSQFKEITHKRFTAYKHDKLTLKELENSELIRFVSDTYKKLGGQLHTLPINYGSWDISTKDFIIELDEERHFNRYRLETLNSKFYNNYKGFSVTNYKNYCKDYECRCLKAANWGNNWKNDSTEKMVSITGISSLACGSNYGECYRETKEFNQKLGQPQQISSQGLFNQ